MLVWEISSRVLLHVSLILHKYRSYLLERAKNLLLLRSHTGSLTLIPGRHGARTGIGVWVTVAGARGFLLVPTQDQGSLEAGELAQLWGETEKDWERVRGR